MLVTRTDKWPFAESLILNISLLMTDLNFQLETELYPFENMFNECFSTTKSTANP